MCGICRAVDFDSDRAFFEQWLEDGCHGGLAYLERNVDKRFSPSTLVRGARSVVVCGVVYRNDTSLTPDGPLHSPRVASYARSVDYHVTIKEMLMTMAGMLGLKEAGVGFRAFTDTAPLAEKRLAREAGLGFIGRNTLLVSPRLGSFLLLGELVVCDDADSYDEPYAGPACGRCRRCIDACPAGALTSHGLDARLCIARATIEPAYGDSRPATDTCGWIFGCDCCQSVCPYNAAAPVYVNDRFRPLFDPRAIGTDEWLAMSEEEFGSRFASTPLSRSGLERIKTLLRCRYE